MPIGLWLKWKAWFIFQGPPGGLGDDLRAAVVALESARPHIAEQERLLANFLPPLGRRTADFANWLDFGVDADLKPAEYLHE